jgi:DNA-binding MarR family transcriptional regulator
MQIKLTPAEKAILTVLLRRESWLNTSQIAELAQVSWNTADKYIKKMYNRGWLSKNGKYWKARR